jgi:CRISPR-associated protein Cas6
VGIHPVRGRIAGQRGLHLEEHSRLTFRAPAGLIGQLLPLAGQTLDLDGSRLPVGVPQIRMLAPAARLHSRLAVIKGMTEPSAFLESARGLLSALEVAGDVRLVQRRSARPVESGESGRGEWVRRTLRVKDRQIDGYAVEVDGLSPPDSLRLQGEGLGGRRRFGCGILLPSRVRS